MESLQILWSYKYRNILIFLKCLLFEHCIKYLPSYYYLYCLLKLNHDIFQYFPIKWFCMQSISYLVFEEVRYFLVSSPVNNLFVLFSTERIVHDIIVSWCMSVYYYVVTQLYLNRLAIIFKFISLILIIKHFIYYFHLKLYSLIKPDFKLN